MFIRSLLALVLTATALPASAVTVVLLENYHDGKRIELEPGGQFSHVAISYRGRWLHAHRAVGRDGGVELTDDIERFGRRPLYLAHPGLAEPSADAVARYMTKSYSRGLDWVEGDDTTYSARLVGELLGLGPREAKFAAPAWQGYRAPSGVGLSPDDIFWIGLYELGFEEERGCTRYVLH